jgi:hypothetical protein
MMLPSRSATRHHNLGLVELCSEKRGVSLLGLRRGRDETLRVEIVVHPNERRAELADAHEV